METWCWIGSGHVAFMLGIVRLFMFCLLDVSNFCVFKSDSKFKSDSNVDSRKLSLPFHCRSSAQSAPRCVWLSCSEFCRAAKGERVRFQGQHLYKLLLNHHRAYIDIYRFIVLTPSPALIYQEFGNRFLFKMNHIVIFLVICNPSAETCGAWQTSQPQGETLSTNDRRVLVRYEHLATSKIWFVQTSSKPFLLINWWTTWIIINPNPSKSIQIHPNPSNINENNSK